MFDCHEFTEKTLLLLLFFDEMDSNDQRLSSI